MTAGFLLAVTDRPVPHPPGTDASSDWSTTDGLLHLSTWVEHGEAQRHLTSSAATAWAGWPLPVGGVGAGGREGTGEPSPAEVAAALALRAGSDEPDAADHLRGTYAAVAIDADGHGRAFADPHALRPLYWARTGSMLLAGSDARAVAEAAAGAGAAPARDAMAACALAAGAHRPPSWTGYAGVQALPPGAQLRFGPGGHVELVDPGPPWLRTEGLAHLDEADLVDRAGRAIAAGLLALVTGARGPGGTPVVELTGGKDSRLVLAMLLELGLADRLRFETAGPPELPDVVVAAQLAQLLGLDHHRVFASRAEPRSTYAARFDAFVERTWGMVNAWNVRPLSAPSDEVRVSGLNGEALRSHWPDVIDGAAPVDRAARRAALDRAMPTGALGLARPELRATLDDAFAAVADDLAGRTTTVGDALDSWSIAVRAHQQYGPLDEIVRWRRFIALYAPEATRVAFALDADARRTDRIHRALVGRADPRLLTTTVLGPGWPGASPPGTGSSASAAPPGLVAALQATLGDEQRRVLDELLADGANPAWDLLDRGVAIDALCRYDDLDVRRRKELFGAATAARWLAS